MLNSEQKTLGRTKSGEEKKISGKVDMKGMRVPLLT